MTSTLGPSEGQAVVKQQEIVSFVEDGAVAESQIPPTQSVPTHMDADDMMVNSVKSFLQRPILFNTLLWNTSQTALTELANVRMPRNWLANTMIREKLAGFRYLKCDFKVRVQVNAMPFQAGRLLLYFDPLYSQLRRNPTSILHFGGITGYPHVELDLMNETSMELTLPFNNILTHFDLIKGIGATGSAQLVVYSPLTGDAASTADVSIWMWAENIDLQLPTGMPMAPGDPNQSLRTYVNSSGESDGNLYELEDEEDNAQSGEEKKRPGNIETISRVVGQIASKMGEIPFLGAIAAPISAVADAVTGVSSLFGFSKPQDPEFPIKAELGYAKYFTNFNGDSKAKVLSLDARNQVSMVSYISPSKDDELSLAHLVQKPTFLGRFNWSTTDVSDTVVFNVPNVPDYCVTATQPWAVGADGALVHYNTMLSYLSGLFAFWRGSLRYKFKIVKSPFHTGRLRVDLVPGFNAVGDVYVREKVYSQIIDIRETNEFEIEVPYKWNAPWKRLAMNPLLDKNRLSPTALLVRVLNPLRNGGQSAPNVELIVEVSGGKDFQFAYPYIKGGMRPMNSPPPTSTPDNCQSGEVIAPGNPGYEANSIGVGEVVTSLRQLLKRYVRVPDSLVTETQNNIAININSSSHTVSDGLDATKPLASAPVFTNTPDFLSYISYLYRFRSGSIRAAIELDNEYDRAVTRYTLTNISNFPREIAYAPTTGDDRTISETSPCALQFYLNEPFCEIAVPYYQLWPATPTPLGLPNLETGSGLTPGLFTNVPYNPGSALNISASPTQFSHMTVHRAIGEDYNLSFSVGPPLTIQARPLP
jgi:hypothetical protein